VQTNMFWRMTERETWTGKVGLGWQERAVWRGIRVCQVEVSPVEVITSKPTFIRPKRLWCWVLLNLNHL
jgi:hypothetical protein